MPNNRRSRCSRCRTQPWRAPDQPVAHGCWVRCPRPSLLGSECDLSFGDNAAPRPGLWSGLYARVTTRLDADLVREEPIGFNVANRALYWCRPARRWSRAKAIWGMSTPQMRHHYPRDRTGHSESSQRSMIAADLTGDNVVDVFDLLELLAVWGPCEIGAVP